MISGAKTILQQFSRLLGLWRIVHIVSAPCRGLFYTAGIFSVLVGVADAIFLLIAVSLVGDVFGLGSIELPYVFQLMSNLALNLVKNQPLLSGVFALAIATISRQIFTGLSRTMSFWATAIVIRHVRITLTEKLLDARFSFLDTMDSGAPRQIVAKEAVALVHATRATVDVISQTVAILLITILLMQFSPTLTTVFAALALLAIPGKYLFSRRLSRLSKRATDSSVSLMGILNELLMAIRPIKLQNRQVEFLDRLSREVQRMEVANRQVSLLVVWEPLLVQIVAVTMMSLGLLFSYVFQLGTTTELVAFFVMLYRMIPFVSGLSQAFSSLIAAHPAVQKTVEYLFIAPANLELDSGSVRFTDPIQRLDLESVQFAYRSDRPVLHCVNMDASRGEMVAVVGASGSGKSSLVHLLMRMYQPDAGRILIDGQDASRYGLKDLRSRLGIVSQDVHLLNASIADTIRAGNHVLSDEEMVAAATLAQAHEFIQALPDGYRSTVGERGQALSGGQRQRLLLAQVLARSPQVLILDEATSALDPQTEGRVLAALKEDQARRITLVITHRLTNLVNVDRIYVLQSGRVVEQGNWHELVKRRGYFFDLLSHQQEAAERWQADPAIQPLALHNF